MGSLLHTDVTSNVVATLRYGVGHPLLDFSRENLSGNC